MAISVGIESAVNITKLFIDEMYGGMKINVARLETAPAEAAVEVDDFDALLGGTTGTIKQSQYKEETNLSLYPVKSSKYGNPLSSAEVGKEFLLFRATLMHILVQGKLAEQYNQVAQKDRAKFLTDFIKFPKTMAFMKEQGVTKDTVEQKFQDDALLEAISLSYFHEAAELLTELEVPGKPLRAIFIRQSAAKHYPKLREAKFDEQFFVNSPVFEREDLVPADKSKLKFSNYELDKGLNNGDKLEADPTTQSADVNALFGETVEANPFN